MKNFKKTISAIAAVLLSTATFAQAPTTEWYRSQWDPASVGGLQHESGEEWARKITKSYTLANSPDGYIVSGYSSAKNYFFRHQLCGPTYVTPTYNLDKWECSGPSLLMKGPNRASLFKIDESGDIKWHQTYGGYESSEFFSVIQSADKQYYYACGWTTDPTLPYNNQNDVMSDAPSTTAMCQNPSNTSVKHFYVVKVDRNGNSVWQMIYGATAAVDNPYTHESGAYDIVEDVDGDLIVVGYSDVVDPYSFAITQEAFAVKLDGVGGNLISSTHTQTVNNYNVELYRSIEPMDDNTPNEFALVADKYIQPFNAVYVTAQVIDNSLSVVYTEQNVATVNNATLDYGYSSDLDIRIEPTSSTPQMLITVLDKDAFSPGSGSLLLYIMDVNGGITPSSAPLPQLISTPVGAAELQAGVVALNSGKIAVISSSKANVSLHVNEYKWVSPFPFTPVNNCTSPPHTISSTVTQYWGADALLCISDKDATNWDVIQTYEHEDVGNFGTHYPSNVSQMECMHGITEGHDGTLVACGSDGANFDDYVLMKFGKSCNNDPNEYSIVGEQMLFTTGYNYLTGYQTVYGNITIPNGVTLSIHDALLEFHSTGEIIVEEGGRLIIERSRLTNACPEAWQGIFVYGDPSMPQTPTSSLHGKVTILEGSIIENAERGVYLGELNSGGLPPRNGGMLYAEASYFFNSRVNIDIPAYPFDNLSEIEDCTFDCFLALHGPAGQKVGTLHHLAVVETGIVKVYGSNFYNTGGDNLYFDNFRGNGIQVVLGTILVDRGLPALIGPDMCGHRTGSPCVFEDLNRGINIYDYGNALGNNRENIIIGAEANNCLTGINLDCNDSRKVFQCDINYEGELSADFNGTNVIGIRNRVEDAGYTLIDNNTITFALDFTRSEDAVGMEIENTDISGNNSYIYNNTIRNFAPRQVLDESPFGSSQPQQRDGISFIDNNTLIELKCNTHENLNKDWVQLGGSNSIPDQEAPNEGWNTFSLSPINSTTSSNLWAASSVASFSASTAQSITDVYSYGTPYNYATMQPSRPMISCPVTSVCEITGTFETLPGAQYDPGPVNHDLIFRDDKTNINAPNKEGDLDNQKTTTTGINDIDADVALNLYPNPSNDFVVVEFKVATANATVRVTNTFGQVVMEKTADTNEGNFRIDVSEWAAGVYIINLDNGNGGITTKRFVVVK